ncbi:hypothetical protein KFZ56_05895 [Virgibacillus sp. NKC19-3]|uniref:hypothetical protein n=1 Tax=Virgibacillus saliphilus TaxID=2831674 RepID=UPI001C9B4983|nr:hypothetical protein [Virgibacillus sp. NKC19-3]MBY7142618.1 hypothetical protein [Virgibacillus sp. NKC19-3]
MKKVGVVLGLVFISFMVVACNNTDETDSADETSSNNEGDGIETGANDANEDTSSDKDIVKDEDEGSNQDNEAEEQDYTEERVAGDYLIYGEWLEGTDFLLYFTRTTDELTSEERLHQSFMESDPSQRDLFSATTDFEVDGTAANLFYREDDDLSMASTESAQFWEVLHEIGFRYGLDAFNLFNQDGERGLGFAENYWEEPVDIEQEPNRGYYVVSPEQSERGEDTYISGAVAEEEIYTEDDELLDFNQTVETMETTTNDEEDYYSGIHEGVEIEEAMIDGNQAVVTYHKNEDAEVSQQEREDFEQVLQLAALDFQVEELKLVNETDRVISVYPLLEGMDDNHDAVADDDSHSEDDSGTDGQEENAALTEEDATGNVFDYVDEHEDADREEVKAMVQDEEDEEGYFTVQAFVYSSSGDDDEVQMTNTIGWYLVDKETGEVEEKEF